MLLFLSSGRQSENCTFKFLYICSFKLIENYQMFSAQMKFVSWQCALIFGKAISGREYEYYCCSWNWKYVWKCLVLNHTETFGTMWGLYWTHFQEMISRNSTYVKWSVQNQKRLLKMWLHSLILVTKHARAWTYMYVYILISHTLSWLFSLKEMEVKRLLGDRIKN
jgi:hypothetical protein